MREHPQLSFEQQYSLPHPYIEFSITRFKSGRYSVYQQTHVRNYFTPSAPVDLSFFLAYRPGMKLLGYVKSSNESIRFFYAPKKIIQKN